MEPKLARLRPGRRGAAGFTLIEVSVALAIAAILVTISVPSYQRFVAKQRVKAATADLHMGLLLARSEAIKRNAVVTLSPAGQCWNDGWNVLVGTTKVATQGPIKGMRIKGGSAPLAEVSFNSDGRLVSSSSPFEIASVKSDVAESRCLTLDLSGRPVSAAGACKTAVVSCS